METCFDSYLYKLTEMEEKDIRQLKQRKHKLTEMKRNLLKDLDETKLEKEDKLREREHIHIDNSSFLEKRGYDSIRMRCEQFKQEVEELSRIHQINKEYAKENA